MRGEEMKQQRDERERNYGKRRVKDDLEQNIGL
jgi:hypothetical protein